MQLLEVLQNHDSLAAAADIRDSVISATVEV
jgi:hypothetical protein